MQEDRRELELDAITCGDCMEWLRTLPDGCADLVLTDPPYGTTHNAWDKLPDFRALFAELWRVLKHNGALLMFAQNPLAAELIVQERKRFRYEWVWEKGHAVGFANAGRMPLRAHELVLVFYRALPTWNAVPITGQAGECYERTLKKRACGCYGSMKRGTYTIGGRERFPRDVVKISRPGDGFHPTQKPQALCEMLIQQYTRRGELVVDPFAGSGTTAAAAMATGQALPGLRAGRGVSREGGGACGGGVPPHAGHGAAGRAGIA